MVISDVALTRITTLVAADIIDGKAGTDTTLPTSADTTLNTPVADTEVDVDVITASNNFSVTHSISSVLGNGSDLTEWQIRMNAEATQLSRVVTAPVTKTSTLEVTKITLFDVVSE